MTTPRLAPKSLTGARPALPAARPSQPRPTVGEPKGAARKGVRTPLRSEPQTGDGRYPVAWLTITAPRGAVPTATSKCLCGRDRCAIGYRRVLALIADHEDHRENCPFRVSPEGRTAA
ncbi:hypothetical protein AB0I98_39275 [Streptomyces sp. NPDC050211]|uniref:hypothetical protein n=1 Tax=Streptomyces sp. NPDC050211 TaxID=3154932 RepID=UPI003414C656